MEKDNNFMDLVYFGYDYYGEESKESIGYQNEFMKDIKERFPDVKFKDAYDQIKGFRQEVILPEEKKEDYYSWIIAFGWLEFSLSMQLLSMSTDKRDELMSLIDKAKKEYPQNFKS
jgi:hypothetical protein